MAKKRKKAKRKLSPYNRHVQREMKAGRSMKQAAASWKPGRKKSRSTSRRSSVSRRVTRRVSRRAPKKVGKKVGKGGFNQQKLFKLARMAAMLGPHAAVWMSAGTPQEKATASIKFLSGFDMNTGQFEFDNLVKGYGPLLATGLITAVIPKINGLVRGLM